MPLPIFQEKASHNHPLSKIKYIIGIAAGKGGVGKSSVSVNLAMALQMLGHSVGIMDTDIYGPSIRKMLPEDRLPLQKDSIIHPALSKGLKIISMAYFRRDREATAVRAPIANGMIAQFIKNIEWGPLDFLLVDFPPGTGDVQLTVSQQAHLMGAIMVTTPQEVALLDVRKAMSLFEYVKIPIIGIVENMSYYQESESSQPIYLFGSGGGERLANESGVPFLGHIPLDPLLCSAADKGKTIFEMDSTKQRSSTQAFISLAEQLSEQLLLLKIENQGIGTFEMLWKEMNK